MELTEGLVISSLRGTWQPVANSSALPAGAVTAYTLLGCDLLLARFAGGQLLAADVACPHKGARLSVGCIRDGELVCPYHGWRFDAAGACKNIPSLLEPSSEKLALSHLRTYPVQERYGYVWVKLDSTGQHDLPAVPEFEDPTWTSPEFCRRRRTRTGAHPVAQHRGKLHGVLVAGHFTGIRRPFGGGANRIRFAGVGRRSTDV